MTCIQTACKQCGLDIENTSPFDRNQWRDRGNNTKCPNSQRNHVPTEKPPRLTKRRVRIGLLLQNAADTQSAFWDALHELEAEIGYCDGIGDEDLENHDADTILQFAKEHAEQ